MRFSVILKRELLGYFATPIAYVFIAIFLVLSGVFTFYLGNFYERQQADLIPFFSFHPWLYLFLVPAIFSVYAKCVLLRGPDNSDGGSQAKSREEHHPVP